MVHISKGYISHAHLGPGKKKEKNRIENVTVMGHSSPKNIINNIFLDQEKLLSAPVLMRK